MIPVRIAANLTPTGTDGVRWVLVDDAETGSLQPAVEPAPPAHLQDDVHSRPRTAVRWIRFAVLLAGLAGAAATTHCIVGEHNTAPARHAGQTIEPGAVR